MAAPASKRCHTENIIDVEQGELSFSVEWMDLKIPHFTQLYKMPNVIYDISFSSTSPDVLYILTDDGAIHSLNITTLAVTKIINLQSVRDLLCHNDILYISTSATIYKYTTDGECLTSINNDGDWWFGAVGKDDKLYYRSVNRRSIGVIDSDTMTLISTISLCHDAYRIAVSQDDKLHVTTGNGVHIYRADASYTGMVYLEGERCRFIACTSNGYIVEMERKVAVVSSNLTSTHYIMLSNMSWWCYARCSPVDNTLAIVDRWNGSFILLPQDTYQPPFSLSTLCKSTILSHPDVLLTTFLPPIIYRQFKHHINISVKY